MFNIVTEGERGIHKSSKLSFAECCSIGRRDGRPDGRRDGRLDGRLDGRPDGHLDGRPEVRRDGLADGRLNGRRNGLRLRLTIATGSSPATIARLASRYLRSTIRSGPATI